LFASFYVTIVRCALQCLYADVRRVFQIFINKVTNGLAAFLTLLDNVYQRCNNVYQRCNNVYQRCTILLPKSTIKMLCCNICKKQTWYCIHHR